MCIPDLAVAHGGSKTHMFELHPVHHLWPWLLMMATSKQYSKILSHNATTRMPLLLQILVNN